MAGARPSGFKQGGGFLNNVDGVIAGYEFTTDFPGAKTQKGKDDKDFTPLYSVLLARVDGAEEDVQTTLFAGSADDFEIGDGGHTLTPMNENIGLRANTGWGKFIASLVEGGFPETNLPEHTINFEAIIGTRVRFKQQVDEDATKRLGKRKDKKTGKEYPRTDVVVDTVLALPGDAAKGTWSAKAPGRLSVSGPTVKKPNGQGASDDELRDMTDDTLMAILKDTKGEIMKSKLPVKLAQKLGVKHPQREDVRRLMYSDDYLTEAAARGLILYDPADKTQTICVAE